MKSVRSVGKNFPNPYVGLVPALASLADDDTVEANESSSPARVDDPVDGDAALVERCELLSRALLRASLEDPYGDEANALAAKLFEAKLALRRARGSSALADSALAYLSPAIVGSQD